MPGVQALPVLYVVGTHYEVGYSVGSTFSERIKSYWKESRDVQKINVAFHETAEGKAFFEATLDVCRRNFPQYIEEIRGIADGAGLSFENIFTLNLSQEVHTVLSDLSLKQRQDKEIAGCTDVLVNNPSCKIIGHNEDCDPMVKTHGYFVNARILDESGVDVENFTAHCYPGFLPGTTLSFNRYGMVFTIDYLFADFFVYGAAPRIFLNRSIIKARTFEEAIELIKNKGFGAACGFAVNIADLKSPKNLWSVEIGPQAEESMYHVHTVSEVADPNVDCYYIHVNNFKHLKTTEIPNLIGSVARSKRAEEFTSPKNRDDVINILGDQTNEQYPIYRTESPLTAFTGIVDILHNRLDIYVEKPSQQGVEPLIHFSIMDK